MYAALYSSLEAIDDKNRFDARIGYRTSVGTGWMHTDLRPTFEQCLSSSVDKLLRSSLQPGCRVRYVLHRIDTTTWPQHKSFPTQIALC